MSRLFILTGPSCAGKTTIMNQLLAKLALKRLPTATTRPPRPDDEPGAYFYLCKKRFNSTKMYAKNEYLGNSYGIPADVLESFLSHTGDYITVLDVTGAKEMKELLGNNAKVIFVNAPLRTIDERLSIRGDSDKMQRLAKAKEELKLATRADAMIINDGPVLDAVKQATSIIR